MCCAVMGMPSVRSCPWTARPKVRPLRMSSKLLLPATLHGQDHSCSMTQQSNETGMLHHTHDETWRSAHYGGLLNHEVACQKAESHSSCHSTAVGLCGRRCHTCTTWSKNAEHRLAMPWHANTAAELGRSVQACDATQHNAWAHARRKHDAVAHIFEAESDCVRLILTRVLWRAPGIVNCCYQGLCERD
jgi:hypothetical protein